MLSQKMMDGVSHRTWTLHLIRNVFNVMVAILYKHKLVRLINVLINM